MCVCLGRGGGLLGRIDSLQLPPIIFGTLRMIMGKKIMCSVAFL